MTVLVGIFCFVYGFFYALFTPYMLVIFFIPPALLAVAVVWTLPATDRPPLRSVENLFFAFTAALVVWPRYLALALPGLPWITMDRLTGFPLVFLLLVSLSTSPSFRKSLIGMMKTRPPIFLLLGIFVLIQFASIGFSHDKGQSVQKFLVAQISWTAIAVTGVYIFSLPGRLETWARTLWLTAIVVGAIAAVEHVKQQAPWVGHIPSFLKVEDPSVLRTLAGGSRAATGEYRVSSTFSTPLGLAEFLALSMPFVVYFAVYSTNSLARVAAAATVPFLFTIIVWTDSRLGMVGFLGTSLLYPLAFGVLRWRARRDDMVGPAIVLAYPLVFAGFVVATLFVHRLNKAIWGGGAQAASTATRQTQVHIGIPMILRHPWGHGIGMGADALGFVSPAGVPTIDSYYLSIGLEYGIIGFIVYFSLILTALYAAGIGLLKQGADAKQTALLVPIVISLINFVVVKSVFSQQDNHPLVFMMIGATVAVVSSNGADASMVATPHVRRQRWWRRTSPSSQR